MIFEIIPPGVIALAEQLRVEMEKNGFTQCWVVGGVCSRDHAEKVKELEAKLTAYKAVLEAIANEDYRRQIFLNWNSGDLSAEQFIKAVRNAAERTNL